MRNWQFVLFVTGLVILLFLPDPEQWIVRIIDRAGWLVIIAFGLTGAYKAFKKMLQTK